MNKNRYIGIILSFLFAVPCLAHKEQKPFLDILSAEKKPVCIATTLTDSSKIIDNPGNCPIEFLRRLGRALAKTWPEGKKSYKTAMLMFNEYLGRPDFLKVFPEDKLSKEQIDSLDKMIDSHDEAFKEIASDFESHPEAITVKMVVNPVEIQNNLKKLITETSEKMPALPESEKEKIKANVLPIVEAFSDGYALVSISEKGVYSRINADSEKGNLQDFISLNNLTIQDYIDEEPMIILAQTHSIQEPSAVMSKLDAIPNMKVVNQFVASAGLNFEKDLIGNYATESVLYINLTPTGEKMIPDVRWVAKIPNAKNLTAILPKLQNLCMQTGIFVNNIDSQSKDTNIVKLSHFVLNGYSIYAALTDQFCVITSTQEGAESALKYIKNPIKKANLEYLKDCNLYFRLKTSDLNIQLQQFLQSPIIRDKGIPPITNLTFLNDMKDVTVTSKMTNKKIKINLDIPFIKKNNN